MFKVLIDTCVWIELAKSYDQQSILAALEELVRSEKIELILPRTVIDEFARHKAHVIEEASCSLSSTLKRTKEAVWLFGDPKQMRLLLHHLNELDYRLPTLGEVAIDSVGRIEKLFAATPITEISDVVKARAAQRGVDKRAPFHRHRNGTNDSILVEVYANVVSAKTTAGTRFAFVTHNTKDFSHPNANNRLPHPDIASCFSPKRSLYFIRLGEALRRVQPVQYAHLMIEHDWAQEPRRLAEILEAIDELVTKVWYNRHQVTRERIEEGKIKIVEKEIVPVNDHTTRPIQT